MLENGAFSMLSFETDRCCLLLEVGLRDPKDGTRCGPALSLLTLRAVFFFVKALRLPKEPLLLLLLLLCSPLEMER